MLALAAAPDIPAGFAGAAPPTGVAIGAPARAGEAAECGGAVPAGVLPVTGRDVAAAPAAAVGEPPAGFGEATAAAGPLRGAPATVGGGEDVPTGTDAAGADREGAGVADADGAGGAPII